MKPTRRLRNPARSFSPRVVVSMPSKRYCPPVGRSRQPRIFSNVDFPEPDGPVIDSHSPRHSTRSTSDNAWTIASVPNCLHTLLRWISGSGAVAIASAGNSTRDLRRTSFDLRWLGADHHVFTRSQLPTNRGHLDVTARCKPRSDVDVFRLAVAINENACGSVRGQPQRIGRNHRNRALRGFDRNGETHGKPGQAPAWHVIELGCEVEVIPVHAVRPRRGRYGLDDARSLHSKRLLVDPDLHAGPHHGGGFDRQSRVDAELVVGDGQH